MKRSLLTIRVLVLCLNFVVVSNAGDAQQICILHSRKLDEFYGSNWESAMARLDNLALDMQDNPTEIGVIIVYGGQHGRRGEAQAWGACVKGYLVGRRGIEANRIVMINGGYREELTVELWETDKDHIPNAEPHIKPKDVKFRRGKIKSLCAV